MNHQELCRELTIYLYAQEKLSFGQARELAGLNAWDFQQLLGSRGIDAHYGPDDYEQDLQTLRALGRL
jgi:predicted HTH domain antitoxin